MLILAFQVERQRKRKKTRHLRRNVRSKQKNNDEWKNTTKSEKIRERNRLNL